MASTGGAVARALDGPDAAAGDSLFEGLVVSNPVRRRSNAGWGFSLVTHVVILTAAIVVPILWPEADAVAPDYIRALIYNPPPPPPPPLPRGSALVERQERPKPVGPDEHVKPRETADLQMPQETPIAPEDRAPESEQFGSPTGSDFGVPEGSEFGVEGGVVGGVPGGVLGGVVGGTGDGPVEDYDQPPRLVKKTQPVYPQDAFVKKIEGTVVLEILIDSTGRVARSKVINSIPALDQAAMECVKQWVFTPGIKHGRPVMTRASAPINFRIF